MLKAIIHLSHNNLKRSPQNPFKYYEVAMPIYRPQQQSRARCPPHPERRCRRFFMGHSEWLLNYSITIISQKGLFAQAGHVPIVNKAYRRGEGFCRKTPIN
ncbi:hypothetical protein CDAR_298471 [Caerostris darwini]|uniref:Uncharacterized protein n=1 Tax=Caerostris darwini TaxID=1538125 RepID=A0AAV4TJ94_9ARAC|nr:hypothetical protein CDAR_298471 [Caerostris darwini]